MRSRDDALGRRVGKPRNRACVLFCRLFSLQALQAPPITCLVLWQSSLFTVDVDAACCPMSATKDSMSLDVEGRGDKKKREDSQQPLPALKVLVVLPQPLVVVRLVRSGQQGSTTPFLLAPFLDLTQANAELTSFPLSSCANSMDNASLVLLSLLQLLQKPSSGLIWSQTHPISLTRSHTCTHACQLTLYRQSLCLLPELFQVLHVLLLYPT